MGVFHRAAGGGQSSQSDVRRTQDYDANPSVDSTSKGHQGLEDVSDDLYEKGATLDRYYIPTRYPNGFQSGAPMEYFFQKDAEEAISYAEAIIRFCGDKIAR